MLKATLSRFISRDVSHGDECERVVNTGNRRVRVAEILEPDRRGSTRYPSKPRIRVRSRGDPRVLAAVWQHRENTIGPSDASETGMSTWKWRTTWLRSPR